MLRSFVILCRLVKTGQRKLRQSGRFGSPAAQQSPDEKAQGRDGRPDEKQVPLRQVDLVKGQHIGEPEGEKVRQHIQKSQGQRQQPHAPIPADQFPQSAGRSQRRRWAGAASGIKGRTPWRPWGPSTRTPPGQKPRVPGKPLPAASRDRQLLPLAPRTRTAKSGIGTSTSQRAEETDRIPVFSSLPWAAGPVKG